MGGQVDREQRTVERQCDRVEGVRVLGASVHENQLGFALAPAQTTQLTQPVDRDIEALHRGNGDAQTPLLQVFVEEGELVVGNVTHLTNGRAVLLLKIWG